MRPTALLSALLALAAATATAQTPAGPSDGPPPIADNSFLIEEAYNQERGVVQHIGVFTRAQGGTWVFGFTQEWPLRGQAHQLSYSLALARAEGRTGTETGAGDVAINYRYQLPLGGGARTAIAPRLSIILPTGDPRRGLGGGGTGVQVNLPVSRILGGGLVAHTNAGATFTPSGSDDAGNRAATRAVSLGQSVIWLVRPMFNVMFEGVWAQGSVVVGDGRTRTQTSAFISPGVRTAVNFASGLQIVPGLAVPVGVGPSRRERSVLAYLSFEHPFSRSGQE